jgi:hypothetical protein
MKMGVFWAAAITLMMEVASTSKKSVTIHQTTRRGPAEDSHFKLVSLHVTPFEKLDAVFRFVAA